MSEQTQPSSSAGGHGVAETGPLVHLHFAPSRMLWRIGPAWAVVAGAVAAGAFLGNAASLLRLATAVILADLVWGILRRIIPDSPGTGGTAALRAPSLPYGRSDAPLARVMQTVASGQHASTAPWLGWLGGLALTVVLSWLLGAPTLLISAAAVGLFFLTRALFRHGCCPSFCLALLDVGLPWALGAALVWSNVDGEMRGWLVQMGMLAAAFTVLQWGLYRARFSDDGRRLIALYIGQAVLLGALVLLRQSWAVVIAALLLAPPTWWLARRGAAEVALARALPWWWASMLAVAAIVR
jgi:hypothetical protein